MLLAPTGAVGATFTFGAYGAETGSTGTLKTALLYAQTYTDPATGLLYAINRYYDPGTGQFMTLDPDLKQTRRPYSYASDDPVNFVDPSGMFGFTLCFGGCIGWNNGVTVGIGLGVSFGQSQGDGSSESLGAMPFGSVTDTWAAGSGERGVRSAQLGARSGADLQSVREL